MKRKLITSIVFILLCVVTLVISVNSSRAQRNEFEAPVRSQADLVKPLSNPQELNQPLPTDCAIQPGVKQRSSGTKSTWNLAGREPISLLRFRRVQFTNLANPKISPSGQRPLPDYQPREEIALIHPTNYGDRFLKDIYGKPANLEPIVVLHETVASANSTLNFFRTAHPNEDDQASYHTLIRRDGTIIYLVPPDKRAFGAGNSVFRGQQGPEAVKTHPKYASSVNNFAYHVSLETPADGMNNRYSHSGYTDLQYQSLAWLVAKTAVPDHRITTHQAVDRSGSRMDPRSFDSAKFFQLLQTYTKTDDIAIRCTVPADALQSKR